MPLFRQSKPAKYVASILTLLVLVAFLMSSLVPVGFMPEFADDGSYEIVICSGMGTKTITVKADGSTEHTQSETPSVCDYKSFASTQSIELVTFAYLAAPVIELGQAVFLQDSVLSQTPLTSLSARGPPAV